MIKYDISDIVNEKFLNHYKVRNNGLDGFLSAYEYVVMGLGDPLVKMDLLQFYKGDIHNHDILHSCWIVKSKEDIIETLEINELGAEILLVSSGSLANSMKNYSEFFLMCKNVEYS